MSVVGVVFRAAGATRRLAGLSEIDTGVVVETAVLTGVVMSWLAGGKRGELFLRGS